MLRDMIFDISNNSNNIEAVAEESIVSCNTNSQEDEEGIDEEDLSLVSNTAYDDIFRTLVATCKSPLLFLLNEVFGEHYTGSEEVEHFQNEMFLKVYSTKSGKRITDSNIRVGDKDTGRYFHIECESKEYSPEIMIRMYEYDSQIALQNSELVGDTFYVTFPRSAVIFLRSTSTTPEQLHITISTPGGNVSYAIETIKLTDYFIDGLFNKKLFFLIPFIPFMYYRRVEKYKKSSDPDLKNYLAEQYKKVMVKLNSCLNNGISNLDYKVITECMKRVACNFLGISSDLWKGVKKTMGGQILDLEVLREIKEAKEEGRIEGKEEGRDEGRNEQICEGIKILHKTLLNARMTEEQRIQYIAREYKKDEEFVRKTLTTI